MNLDSSLKKTLCSYSSNMKSIQGSRLGIEQYLHILFEEALQFSLFHTKCVECIEKSCAYELLHLWPSFKGLVTLRINHPR